MEKNKYDELVDGDSKDRVGVLPIDSLHYADRTAVVDREGRISYRELDEWSNVVAHGLAPQFTSILLLPRRRWFHVAALGVMKSGGRFVFVSPEYPTERIRFIMRDCNARYIITTSDIWKERRVDLEDSLLDGGRVMEIDGMDFEHEDRSDINLCTPLQEAFMLYTSGTTGNPKGVVHRMDVLSAPLHLDTGCEEDLLSTAVVMELNFAAAINDLFDPIGCGGTCHIIDEDMRGDLNALARYVKENGIGRMCVAPAMGVELLRNHDLGLRVLILAGDKVNGMTARMAGGRTAVYNGYGCSETGYELFYRITGEEGLIPLGRPFIEGERMYVLDKQRHQLPAGRLGELYFSSKRIAFRYINLPELSAERFMEDPFRKGYWMLRTCDIGYIDERGDVVLSGRTDNMFKLNGFRIEPGEIENVASTFPGMAASVCVKKVVNGDERLCLFYEAPVQIDKEVLRAHLMLKLAGYMIPQMLIQLDALPRNARGKIDRRALPEPKNDYRALMIAPANNKEALLLEIAYGLLGHRDFGVTDDLTAMGLSSIMAMKMVAEADRQLVRLKMGDIMKLKTIRGVLQNEMRMMEWYNGYDDDRETVVFVSGLMTHEVEVEKYRMWAEHYNVLVIEPLQDHYDYIFQDETTREVVEFYLELLDVYLPKDGRIRVFTGCSFGGVLAYLMACRYNETRGQMPVVVMGDSLLTNIPALDTALLNNESIDSWFERIPDLKYVVVPGWERCVAMVVHLGRFGTNIPQYEGRVFLLHSLCSPYPGDNSELWKKYAKNLCVIPLKLHHSTISKDNPEIMPVWRSVCDSLGSAKKSQSA